MRERYRNTDVVNYAPLRPSQGYTYMPYSAIFEPSVGNQVSVAILLGVGYESHNAVHALYKRRFSQAWPCPVTSHSVSLLLRKS